MNKNSIVESINRLKNMAVFGKAADRLDPNSDIKLFGLGDEAVGFSGQKNVTEYEILFHNLYQGDKNIEEDHSKKFFELELIELLRFLNEENHKPDYNNWIRLLENLKNKPYINAEIFIPIYGVKMKIPLIQLGDFRIYNFPSCVETVKQNHPKFIAEINKEFNDVSY